MLDHFLLPLKHHSMFKNFPSLNTMEIHIITKVCLRARTQFAQQQLSNPYPLYAIMRWEKKTEKSYLIDWSTKWIHKNEEFEKNTRTKIAKTAATRDTHLTHNILHTCNGWLKVIKRAAKPFMSFNASLNFKISTYSREKKSYKEKCIT